MYVLLEQRMGRKTVLQRLSVAALEQEWAAKYCEGLAVPDMQRMLRSLKLDLTALAFISSGNDYLPAMRGYRLEVCWSADNALHPARASCSCILLSRCLTEHLEGIHRLASKQRMERSQRRHGGWRWRVL